ncbi:MAG: imidazoleglycerol-phosphate dehydratase HisB [Acutalibacteraceae bacterium]
MRNAAVERKTKETEIFVAVDLDGGNISIDTGIGFFDHMLTALAMHSGIALTVKAKGDLEVDCHHTVEDVGIVLGQALSKALGDKSGIKRYGSFFIPMDEALAFASIDISGRPFLVFNAEMPQAVVGGFDCCMTEEFFRAFAFNAGITLHIKCEYGSNSHHIIEAIFKAVAHSLACAVEKTDSGKTLSTKGVL